MEQIARKVVPFFYVGGRPSVYITYIPRGKMLPSTGKFKFNGTAVPLSAVKKPKPPKSPTVSSPVNVAALL